MSFSGRGTVDDGQLVARPAEERGDLLEKHTCASSLPRWPQTGECHLPLGLIGPAREW